jgi:LmbE family N-acetylglucosaminyl deacetylase
MTTHPAFASHARRIVFVSPHLDDAALSCGASIWSLGRAGCTCEVVTLFAGETTGPVSSFARRFNAVCSLTIEGTNQRRCEDREAMAALAAEMDHWPTLDAIYRTDDNGRPLYPSRSALFRALQPDDDALVERLAGEPYVASAVARADALVVPLAIGGHVDHVIARRCIEMFMCAHPCRAQLIFYEDLPYACRATRRQREARVPLGFSPVVARLSAEAFDAKARAILCYRSQAGMLRRAGRTCVQQLLEHAASIEPGSLSERFWVPATHVAAANGSPSPTAR